MAEPLTVALPLVGPLAALLLSAALLGMARRESRGASAHRTGSRLAAWTAGAALSWNIGVLTAGLAPPDAAPSALRWLLALACSAFGVLPALFVHAALRGRGAPGPWTSVAVAAGYTLAAAAAILHVEVAAGGGLPPNRGALRALAVGFVALAPAVLLLPRDSRRRDGAVWAAALALFAASAWHLAAHVSPDEPIASVLLGHHASIPLVGAILWQDYRFAFADLFLKRALSLLLLGALVLGLYASVVAPLRAGWAAELPEPFALGLLLAAWGGTALVYPALRALVSRFVDSALLGRSDPAERRTALSREILGVESEEAVMRTVAASLGRALGAVRLGWALEDDPAPAAGTVVFPVPAAEPPRYRLEVVTPAGGRLLSGDLELLEWAALLAARRIDAVRLAHERCQRDLREKQIEQLAAEAELRELRAQLNPHFLFNALNTVGALMRTSPEQARRTLLDLTSLLRAVLRRSSGEFSTLGQELDLVDSYLAIEQARFEERLAVERDVPEELRRALVPPLVLQPLVENAIKHGLGPRREGGRVRLRARARGARLELEVSDDGVGSTPAALARGRARGIGLANVEKRLAAYFGGEGRLAIDSRPGEGTTVTLGLPLLEEGAASRAAERRELAAASR